MFTHPALLRQLQMTAETLRRAGETAWSRRLVQVADTVRKSGWTELGRESLLALFEGQGTLDSVTFGAEHARRLSGRQDLEQANERLSLHRQKLRELGQLPTRQPLSAGAPRKRSPDLE